MPHHIARVGQILFFNLQLIHHLKSQNLQPLAIPAFFRSVRLNPFSLSSSAALFRSSRLCRNMSIRGIGPSCSYVFSFISISKHRQRAGLYRHFHTYQHPYTPESIHTNIHTHQHPYHQPPSTSASEDRANLCPSTSISNIISNTKQTNISHDVRRPRIFPAQFRPSYF